MESPLRWLAMGLLANCVRHRIGDLVIFLAVSTTAFYMRLQNASDLSTVATATDQLRQRNWPGLAAKLPTLPTSYPLPTSCLIAAESGAGLAREERRQEESAGRDRPIADFW
jgi:hypothetical protein